MLTDAQVNALVAGMRPHWARPNVFAGARASALRSPTQTGDAPSGEQTYHAMRRCHGDSKGSTSRSPSSRVYLALVGDQALRSIVIAGRPDIGQPDWRPLLPRPSAAALRAGGQRYRRLASLASLAPRRKPRSRPTRIGALSGEVKTMGLNNARPDPNHAASLPPAATANDPRSSRRGFSSSSRRAQRRVGVCSPCPSSAISSRPASKDDKAINSWIALGPVNAFPVGETRLGDFLKPFDHPSDGQTGNVACWVRRDAGNQFQVFAINCAHLGCPVRWFPQSQALPVPMPRRRILRRRRARLRPARARPLRLQYKIDSGELQIDAGDKCRHSSQSPQLVNRRQSGEKPRSGMKQGRLKQGIGKLHWFERRLGLDKPITEAAAHPVPRRPRAGGTSSAARHSRSLILQIVTGILLALVYMPSRARRGTACKFSTTDHARLVSSRHARLGIGLHGRHRAHPHGAGVPLRRLQISARAHVDHRRLPAPPDPRHGLHRPGPALRSGRLLGPRHRHIDCQPRSLHRRPLVHLLLGGPIIAGATLSRFFALHVFVIPGMLLLSSVSTLDGAQTRRQRVADARPLVQRSTYDREYHDLAQKTAFPSSPALSGRIRLLRCHPARGRGVRPASSAHSAPAASPIPPSSRPHPSPISFSCGSTRFSPTCRRASRRRSSSSSRRRHRRSARLPLVAGEGERAGRGARRGPLVSVIAVSWASSPNLGPTRHGARHERVERATIPGQIISRPHAACTPGRPRLPGQAMPQLPLPRRAGGQRGPALDEVATRLTKTRSFPGPAGRRQHARLGKNLSPAEIEALVSFLETLHPANEPPAYDAARRAVESQPGSNAAPASGPPANLGTNP